MFHLKDVAFSEIYNISKYGGSRTILKIFSIIGGVHPLEKLSVRKLALFHFYGLLIKPITLFPGALTAQTNSTSPLHPFILLNHGMVYAMSEWIRQGSFNLFISVRQHIACLSLYLTWLDVNTSVILNIATACLRLKPSSSVGYGHLVL